MKNINQHLRSVMAALALTLASGCSEDPQFMANNQAAFKACIKSGGVPVQAWFNSKAYWQLHLQARKYYTLTTPLLSAGVTLKEGNYARV